MGCIIVKITIDLTGTLEKLTRAAAPPKPKAKPRSRTPKDTRCDELTMRLMTVDSASDEESMALEMDIASYIQELLASKKKDKAVKFLNDNKHRFTPDMKDTLTGIINDGL